MSTDTWLASFPTAMAWAGSITGFAQALGLLWTVALLLCAATETREWIEALQVSRRKRVFHACTVNAAYRPKVSIHIPCYNEPPDMVRATLDALAALDYPSFEVLVIDNNTPDAAVWKPVRDHCRALGPRFRFFHVAPLTGFKAGALNYLLERTASDAELIAVIDSDYQVRKQWLKHLAPLFADPAIGLVQAPQDYRDHAASIFKYCCNAEYRGFFQIGMVVRNEHNAIIQHGTMTMIRRTVLDTLRWAAWCICEDAELGLRIIEHGFSTAYVSTSHGQGLTPDTFTDYKKQRHRWVYGAVQILKRHGAHLYRIRGSGLNVAQRYHFLAGWLPWLWEGCALPCHGFVLCWSVGISLLPGTLAPLPLWFSVPPVLLVTLRSTKTVHLYRRLAKADFKEALAAILAGLALQHTVAKAVLHGLATSNKPFLRTPRQTPKPCLAVAASEAGEESAMLGLFWLLLVAVWLNAQHMAIQAWAWLAMLAIQSVPYACALVMAYGSARTAERGHLPATSASADRASSQAEWLHSRSTIE